MTFTLLANAILAAIVFVSLIAGICAINGTPLTFGLQKLAQRISAARAEVAKSESSPVRIGLGS